MVALSARCTQGTCLPLELKQDFGQVIRELESDTKVYEGIAPRTDIIRLVSNTHELQLVNTFQLAFEHQMGHHQDLLDVLTTTMEAMRRNEVPGFLAEPTAVA